MQNDKTMNRRSDAAETLFFTLLKAGLHPAYMPGTDCGADEAVWQEVYRTAVRQGVAGIVWDGLQRLDAAGAVPPDKALPRMLKLQWALVVEQIAERYGKQRRIIARLAAFYHSHGLAMMGLKGYGLSLCYPHPEHRPCGDIDIWLFGRQQEADDLLRREWRTPIDTEVHHHTTFTIDGILVENHFDFLNVHAHTSNREIETLLQRYAQEPGPEVDIDGTPLRLPSANFNALFLLRHAASHFAAREIGMRHVVDWAMFIERDPAGIDWTMLRQTARRMNMHRFLSCLNAIAIDYLGTDPAKIPAFERDPALELRVKNDILQPEFSETQPSGGLLRIVWFRTRRWWTNRWKHRIVYREGLLQTFLVQLRSHLMKPRSIAH